MPWAANATVFDCRISEWSEAMRAQGGMRHELSIKLDDTVGVAIELDTERHLRTYVFERPKKHGRFSG